MDGAERLGVVVEKSAAVVDGDNGLDYDSFYFVFALLL